jgi:flagellar protein FlgJ
MNPIKGSTFPSSISQEEDSIKKAAQGLEELFLSTMLEQMRKTVPKGEWSNSAADTFQSMFDSELAKQVAQNGSFGLANQVIDSLQPNNYDKSKRGINHEN